jgi:hypothetical protein
MSTRAHFFCLWSTHRDRSADRKMNSKRIKIEYGRTKKEWGFNSVAE